jgi:hypothetical protein
MVTVTLYVTVIVVLQGIPVTDPGLTTALTAVTTKGPGNVQFPVGLMMI